MGNGKAGMGGGGGEGGGTNPMWLLPVGSEVKTLSTSQRLLFLCFLILITLSAPALSCFQMLH